MLRACLCSNGGWRSRQLGRAPYDTHQQHLDPRRQRANPGQARCTRPHTCLAQRRVVARSLRRVAPWLFPPSPTQLASAWLTWRLGRTCLGPVADAPDLHPLECYRLPRVTCVVRIHHRSWSVSGGAWTGGCLMGLPSVRATIDPGKTRTSLQFQPWFPGLGLSDPWRGHSLDCTSGARRRPCDGPPPWGLPYHAFYLAGRQRCCRWWATRSPGVLWLLTTVVTQLSPIPWPPFPLRGRHAYRNSPLSSRARTQPRPPSAPQHRRLPARS